MGVLDKRIQAAVNQALKPLEKTLVEMAEKNAEENRLLMKRKVDEMNSALESLVEQKVKAELDKREHLKNGS